MHALEMLYKWAKRSLPEIHLGQLNRVFVGVESLLEGQRLSLRSIVIR